MGESKRRKSLNPNNYGKFFSLKTKAEKKKHEEKIIDEFVTKFKAELQTLARSDSLPNDYDFIISDMSKWVQEKMKYYYQSDHELVAEWFILGFAELNLEYPERINPMTFVCCFDVFEPYLSENLKTLGKQTKAQILAEFVGLQMGLNSFKPENSQYWKMRSQI